MMTNIGSISVQTRCYQYSSRQLCGFQSCCVTSGQTKPIEREFESSDSLSRVAAGIG